MPSKHDQNLCRVCAEIDFVEYFRRSVNSQVDPHGFVGAGLDALKLGSFKAIYARSRYCNFCDLLVSAICTKRQRYLMSPETFMRSQGHLECWIFSYCYADSDPSELNSHKAYRIGISSKIENDAKRLLGNDQFYGRSINPEILRISQLQGWTSLCEREHGDRCGPLQSKYFRGSPSMAGPQDLLAIDVKQECICYLPEGARYLALSYCWPSGKSLLLRKDNHRDLFTTGSIAKRIQEISPTVQDAIKLTRNFGEDYLWVDALCIVQDDAVHQQFQISQMDKVYASALVTLVSAMTTMNPIGACRNLPSYRNVEVRNRNQVVSLIRDLHLAVPFESIHSLLQSCRWYTRGWTYQECLLSGRILFFTDLQVYFQCSCAVYCEDSVGEGVALTTSFTPGCNLWNPGSLNSDHYAGDRYGSLHLNLQNEHQYHHYADQLTEYMSRDLSFPSDILNAFRGVQNVLERAMKTKFWCGIPELYIDYCLLWTAKRLRKGSDKPLKETPSRLENFPSWSWAGWNWHVELSNYYGSRGIRREVPWFLINKAGDCISLASKDIPGMLDFPRQHSKDVNMLNSAQAHIPIKPLDRSEVDTESPNWQDPAYLATWTQLANFHLRGPMNQMGQHSAQWPESENLKISNAHGQWVGSILMDWLWVEDNLPNRTLFEFMLVSRSETPFVSAFEHIDFFDPDAPDVCPERPWCILNVMLIERQQSERKANGEGEGSDVIAERRGVGVIHEDAWVQAGPRPSFVRLK